MYNYFYDANNRIKDALYTVPGNSVQDGRFNIGYVNYDPNGNITTLQRVNQQTASIWGLVDNLSYSYATHSNKLSYLYDAQTTPTYLAKDYKNLGTSTYNYDANGNLLGNNDQYSVVITYNHLNLPKSIIFSGTGRSLTYWYNAEGVKVRQVNVEGATTTTLDYLGEFVFEKINSGANTLSYIMHEEGRATYENSAFQYEFFIKDHLGNVRQVVRAPRSALRIATMEPEKAEEEEELFDNIRESRQGASEHNKTPGGYATAWLNADRGRILGPSRSQEVQQGDSVEIGVFGKYVDPRKTRLHPVSFIKTGANTKMIQQLTEFGQNLRATGPNELAIANIIALVITELQQKPAPEAYMGYALYDSDSVLYEQGKVVLSKEARNKHEELIQKLAIKKDGYIETYLVNETSENVWFDQFRIMSTGPLIVQETHYDPWGVDLSGLGYQYGGIKTNPYLYNGKELTSGLGVIMYDYGARFYIPAIGRWFVPDPLAEKARRQSPYNYALNNPMRFIDPDGMEAYSVMGEVKQGEPEPEDSTEKSVVNGEETNPEEDDFLWSDGYGLHSGNNSTIGRDSFNGSYQNAGWTVSQYYAALDGLKLPNGETLSKDRMLLTFMSYSELKKIFPRIREGNAHYLGEKYGKLHVNFSVSDYEETASNIRALGVHEFYGHGIKGVPAVSGHYKAYWFSIDSIYWGGTTEAYRKSVAFGMWSSWYQEYPNQRMPEKYMKIVDKYY